MTCLDYAAKFFGLCSQNNHVEAERKPRIVSQILFGGRITGSK